MKEKRSFKRADLFSVLAAVGVLLVLLFESIFIFELYETEWAEKILTSVPVEEALPAETTDLPAETDAVLQGAEPGSGQPDAASDSDSVPEESEEAVPVG